MSVSLVIARIAGAGDWTRVHADNCKSVHRFKTRRRWGKFIYNLYNLALGLNKLKRETEKGLFALLTLVPILCSQFPWFT